jgi:hypothetical protein
MSTTTSILTDEFMAQAHAFQQAKAQYDKGFRLFLHSVPPMGPDFFWPMVDKFRSAVLSAMIYRRERFAEHAADEFLRRAQFETDSFAEAVHFALSWRDYKDRAYQCGDHYLFSWNRGDDGYGDLMDAVVLLGRDFNERLAAGTFNSLDWFECEAEKSCIAAAAGTACLQHFDCDGGVARTHSDRLALARRLREVVLHGENYFAMSLEDEAQKRIATEAARMEGKQ